MKPLDPSKPKKIMIRATNWVGDAVMTLPAIKEVREMAPQAFIEVVAKPWVATVYTASPFVDRVRVLDDKGRHAGLAGRLRLAAELRKESFDWAVLLQNAIEAALISVLAGIKTRIGFATDGRAMLLTHPVKRGKDPLADHETSYYLHMLHGAGLLKHKPPRTGVRPHLVVPSEEQAWADALLASEGLDQGKKLLCLAPGAAYGPSKRWTPPQFAEAARILCREDFDHVVILGGPGDVAAARDVASALNGGKVLDLTGGTTLGRALALVNRMDLLICNDSGLMHAGAAMGVPTLAVFGPTDPYRTKPQGPYGKVAFTPVDCTPCRATDCPRDHRCMLGVAPQRVVRLARELKAMANGR